MAESAKRVQADRICAGVAVFWFDERNVLLWQRSSRKSVSVFCRQSGIKTMNWPMKVFTDDALTEEAISVFKSRMEIAGM